MNHETALYHVASLSILADIREQGLDGAKTAVRPGFIHFAINDMQAKGYDGQWGGPCVLFSVQVGLVDSSLLGPDREDLSDLLDQAGDERDWDEVSAEESLALCGQCTYEGAIPVTALVVEAFQHHEGGAWTDVSLNLAEWSGPEAAPAIAP